MSTLRTEPQPQQFSTVLRRGIRRVEDQKNVQNSVRLGVCEGTATLQLTDSSLKFSVVFENFVSETGSQTGWVGFYFWGKLVNWQRCFRQAPNDLTTIFATIRHSLHSQFADPYHCPVYLLGNTKKASWQISIPAVSPFSSQPPTALGYIPLMQTETFHSLQDQPILPLEIHTVTLVTDLDRNRLLPDQPLLDRIYTQSLQTLSALFKKSRQVRLRISFHDGDQGIEGAVSGGGLAVRQAWATRSMTGPAITTDLIATNNRDGRAAVVHVAKRVAPAAAVGGLTEEADIERALQAAVVEPATRLLALVGSPAVAVYSPYFPPSDQPEDKQLLLSPGELAAPIVDRNLLAAVVAEALLTAIAKKGR